MISRKEIEQDYTNAKQTGEILKLSPSRISRLCSQGRFKGAFKAGGSWLIPKIAVENFERLSPGIKPRGYDEKKFLEQAINEADNLNGDTDNDK